MLTRRVDADLDHELDALMQSILSYGVPWMESHCSLLQLYSDFSGKSEGMFLLRKPVLLGLLGKTQEALEFIDLQDDKYAHQAWPVNTFMHQTVAYMANCRAWIVRQSSVVYQMQDGKR